jgi:uncharacterized protein YndB with AHSA1/START domain
VRKEKIMSKLKVEINKPAKELIMTREFNATKQMVWDMYTQKDLIEKWWGPTGWMTTVKNIDVRPGGEWFYCMLAPENAGEWAGKESCGKAFYQEVEEPNKLVYKDTFVNPDGSEMPGMPSMIITIYFEENNGVTTLRTVTVFDTEEELQKVVDMGVSEGTGQQFDRLEEYFANKQA